VLIFCLLLHYFLYWK